MHDLVLRAGRQAARLRRFGALLEAHQHFDFRAEDLLVKLDLFFAAAVEE
jgi:hypothetical protein